jgi:hypothetical protein
VRCGVLGAIGLIFTWQASLIDFGDFALPGPGVFPLVLGVLVFVLAAVIGVRDWFQTAGGETVELGHRDVLIVFAAMAAVPPARDRGLVGGDRHGRVLVFLPGGARPAASDRAVLNG